MLTIAQSGRRGVIRLARGYALPAARPEQLDDEPESSQAAARRYRASSEAAAQEAAGTDPATARIKETIAMLQEKRSSSSSSGGGDRGATRSLSRRQQRMRGTEAYQSAKRLADAFRTHKARLDKVKPEPPNEQALPPYDDDAAAEQRDSGFVASVPTSLYSSTTLDPPMPPSERIKGSPKLEDLLAKKPEHVPPLVVQKDRRKRDKYAGEYNRLHSSVANAFLVKQLAKLAREMGIEVGSKDKKVDIVPRILEMWGWEKPLPASKGGSRAVEVRDIELSPAELFLFLRDTETMRDLIQDARVLFTVVKSEEAGVPREAGSASGVMAEELDMPVPEPQTILRATAQPSGLDRLDEALAELRRNMRKERINLEPADSVRSLDVLQAVSSMTDVYLAPTAYGGLVATAAAPKLVGKARRLLQSASLTPENMTQTRSLSAITSPQPSLSSSTSPTYAFNASREFSFFPYAPTIGSSLPWNVIASLGRRALFRLRRVNVWGPKAGGREIDLESEELENAKLTGYRLGSEVVEEIVGGGRAKSLHGLLRKQRNEVDQAWVPEGEKRHSALLRFGHVVYPSSESGPDALLNPPKPGHAPLDYMITTPDPTRVAPLEPIFVDAQTPAIVQYPLSEPVKRSRRVLYVSKKGDGPAIAPSARLSLQCEIKLRSMTPGSEDAMPDSTASTMDGSSAQASTSARGDSDWMKELEKMMGNMGQEAEPAPAGALEAEDEHVAGSAARHPALDVDQASSTLAPQESSHPPKTQATDDAVTLRLQVTRHTDVIMPDRPVDMRVLSSSVSTLPRASLNTQILGFFEGVTEADHAAPRPWSSAPTPAWSSAPAEEAEPATALVPPEKMQVVLQDGSSAWMYLQKDEIVDVAEHIVAVPGMARIGEDNAVSHEDARSTREPARVVLRTVKSVDQLIPEAAKAMVANELECTGTDVPETFWRTLAAVTRDLPPNAGVLRRDILGATL